MKGERAMNQDVVQIRRTRRPLPSPEAIDCVVVGYNEIDYDVYAGIQREMAPSSGAYFDIKTSSVLLHGKRTTYMDLVNHSIGLATGTNPRLSNFDTPQLGACYLVSHLRQRGLQAELVNFFNHQRDWFADLLAQKPSSVAITTTFYVDNHAIVEIVKWVRARSPDTRIIVGGPHVFDLAQDYDPATQDYLFASIGADVYIFDSQGEATLARVVEELRRGREADLSGIPNLIYADGAPGCFRRTARAPENNSLDDNAIDWSSFPADFLAPVVSMRTARSCAFSCSFCNYPTLAGKHVVSDIDSVEGELCALHAQGVRHVCFIDDTFNVPLPRFKRLLRMMIARKLDMKWVSYFRCSNADDEAFDLMAESGCVGVFLGIESGDQEILNYMNKSAKIERYRDGIRKLKQRGIATHASLIVGFPGETRDSITRSLAFIEENEPSFYSLTLYYHDTRSPIHGRADEFGLRGGGWSWSHRSMDWREAAQWTEHGFRAITRSIPMPIVAFGLWSFPYLIANGIDIDRISRFGAVAREMLLGSFGESAPDFTDQETRLIALFQGFRRPRAAHP